MTASARLVHTNQLVSNGVLTLSGYGLRLGIERGHLIAEDGVGKERRIGRYARVGSGIERIVVLGHCGSISLEALRWMHELEIGFLQLGADAQFIASGTQRPINDIRIRRAQAMSVHTETGVQIAQQLLSAKVAGQLALLRRIPDSMTLRGDAEHAAKMLSAATTIADIRYAESRAAAAYWNAWRDIPMKFVGPGASRLPKHWLSVGSRQSPLSGSPRKAATPAHALLNYGYTVLEAEARLAAFAVGCDPDMGIIHSDKTGRSSFACDLMEPVRPLIDEFILHLLETRGFLKTDFFETREGVCRLTPPFAEALARTSPEWRKHLAPIAERIAGLLQLSNEVPKFDKHQSASKTGAWSHRTPLTQRNRSKVRADKGWDDQGVSLALTKSLPRRCKDCGDEVPKFGRALCDKCLKTLPQRASARAAEVQADLRKAGLDGRSTAAAKAKHRENSKRHNAEIAAWKAANPATPNPQAFATEIWPGLANRSVVDLVNATGLSRAMCKLIKSGKRVPHPRHWDAIRILMRK